MTNLDERLSAAAAFALAAAAGKTHPVVADVGCDHGYLAAYLLNQCSGMSVLCCDVSAPSLEKARNLLARRAGDRARFAVADGLAAIDEPVDAIVIAGMGAQMILRIIEQGRARIGAAQLILQANTDLPQLREGLARMGFVIEQEAFTCAAGRHYVTILAHEGKAEALSAREALLGAARNGAQDAGQRAYFAWQRSVRVHEMERVAALASVKAQARMAQNSEELTWISEAMGMNTITVSDVKALVGGIAPYELAEEWDNVGLLVGRSAAQVTRVLVALDLTPGVIDEAKALGAQCIVTHHPIMMSPRRRMTDESLEGRLLLALAENGIAHIAAHTNLDAAPGGVNDTLMKALGASEIAGEGCVRTGTLKEQTTLAELAQLAQRKLRGPVRVYGAGDTPILRLGCCSGAGSSMLEEARALGVDCFITGEMKHHVALEAMDAGVCVLEAGHFETENPVCEVLANALQNAADALQYKLTVFCSRVHPFGR